MFTFKEIKLQNAVRENNFNHVMTLLRSDANPNSCDEDLDSDFYGLSAMHVAAKYCTVPRIIEALFIYGGDFDYYPNDHHCPLNTAIIANNALAVECMLNLGAPINKISQGSSSLQLAVKNNSLPICELLIKAGVNIDFVSEDDETAILIAVRLEAEEIVDLLIDAGVILFNPNDTNGLDSLASNTTDEGLKDKLLLAIRQQLKQERDSFTALHLAVANKDRDALKILLEEKFDPNVATVIRKITPLHIAADQNDVGIIEMLIKAGANPLALTNEYYSARDYFLYFKKQNLENPSILAAESIAFFYLQSSQRTACNPQEVLLPPTLLELFPYSQTWLGSLAMSCGYKKTYLCNGLSHAAAQAALTGDLDNLQNSKFYNRLILLYQLFINASENLTDEDEAGLLAEKVFANLTKKAKLEIMAFLDTIAIFHKINLYPEITSFSTDMRLQGIRNTQSTLVQSVDIENAGGMDLSYTMSGTYSIQELNKFFQELKQHFVDDGVKCSIVISNAWHTINVFLNEDHQWVFIDIENLNNILPDNIGAAVLKAFSKSKYASLVMDFCCLKPNSEKLKMTMGKVVNSQIYKEIHCLEEKINFFDDFRTSWLMISASDMRKNFFQKMLDCAKQYDKENYNDNDFLIIKDSRSSNLFYLMILYADLDSFNLLLDNFSIAALDRQSNVSNLTGAYHSPEKFKRLLGHYQSSLDNNAKQLIIGKLVHSNALKCLQYFLEAIDHVYLIHSNDDDMTPLEAAINLKRYAALILLLEKMANQPNFLACERRLLLFHAIENRDLIAVKILWEYTLDLDTQQNFEWTVLHHAASVKCADIIKFILNKTNSDFVNCRDAEEKPSLWHACPAEDVLTVESHFSEQDRKNILDQAAGCVKLLVMHGADLVPVLQFLLNRSETKTFFWLIDTAVSISSNDAILSMLQKTYDWMQDESIYQNKDWQAEIKFLLEKIIFLKKQKNSRAISCFPTCRKTKIIDILGHNKKIKLDTQQNNIFWIDVTLFSQNKNKNEHPKDESKGLDYF